MSKGRGYKTTIRDFVHKVGGTYVDKQEKFMFHYDEATLPAWLRDLAKSFNKKPRDVLNDIIRYRNSWGYQLKKEGIK